MRSSKGIISIGAGFMTILLFTQFAWGQTEYPVGDSDSSGRWSVGGGIGFLAETPDDTAFAVNAHADRFISDRVSVGPLVQLAFTGDLAQYGFSGRFKSAF